MAGRHQFGHCFELLTMASSPTRTRTLDKRVNSVPALSLRRYTCLESVTVSVMYIVMYPAPGETLSKQSLAADDRPGFNLRTRVEELRQAVLRRT